MSSSSTTALELQSAIARWRKLIAELKEENSRLDAARIALNQKEDELQRVSNEWQETKSETQDAVTKVTEEITASRSEVASLESQTESLRERIEQRRQKTARYEKIISEKQTEVESTSARVYAAEAAVRQRLEAFKTAREDIKNELELKIQKLSELTEKEKCDQGEKIGALEKRIKSIKAVIDGESRQWKAEKDQREKEDKVNCLLALRTEIDAAQRSKFREIDFLRDSTCLKTNIDKAVLEIESLLKDLSVGDTDNTAGPEVT